MKTLVKQEYLKIIKLRVSPACIWASTRVRRPLAVNGAELHSCTTLFKPTSAALVPGPLILPRPKVDLGLLSVSRSPGNADCHFTFTRYQRGGFRPAGLSTGPTCGHILLASIFIEQVMFLTGKYESIAEISAARSDERSNVHT